MSRNYGIPFTVVPVVTLSQTGVHPTGTSLPFLLQCGQAAIANVLNPSTTGAWQYKANLHPDGAVLGFEASGLPMENSLVNIEALGTSMFNETTDWEHPVLSDLITNYSVSVAEPTESKVFFLNELSQTLSLPVNTLNRVVTVHTTGITYLNTSHLRVVYSPTDKDTNLPIIISYNINTKLFSFHPQLEQKYSEWSVADTTHIVRFVQSRPSCIELVDNLPVDGSNNYIVPFFVEAGGDRFVQHESLLYPPDISLLIDDIEGELQNIPLVLPCHDIDLFLSKTPVLSGGHWNIADLILFIACKYFNILYPEQISSRLVVAELICDHISRHVDALLSPKQTRSEMVGLFGQKNGSHYVDATGSTATSPLFLVPETRVNFVVDVDIRLNISAGEKATVRLKQLPFCLRLTDN